MRLSAFYDRTSLIEACIRTVVDALLEGSLFVILVLFLFLAELRTALVVVFSLPFTFLVSLIGHPPMLYSTGSGAGTVVPLTAWSSREFSVLPIRRAFARSLHRSSRSETCLSLRSIAVEDMSTLGAPVSLMSQLQRVEVGQVLRASGQALHLCKSLARNGHQATPSPVEALASFPRPSER